MGGRDPVSTIGEPVPEALDWLRPQLGELYRTYQQLSQQVDSVSALEQTLTDVLDADSLDRVESFFRGDMDDAYGVGAGQRARDALGFWLASPRAHVEKAKWKFTPTARFALAVVLLVAVIVVALAIDWSGSSRGSKAVRSSPTIDRHAVGALRYDLVVPRALPPGWVLESAGVIPAVTGNTTCKTVEFDYRRTNTAVPGLIVYEVPTSCGAGVPVGSEAVQAGPFTGFAGTDPVTNQNGLRLYVRDTTIIAYAKLDRATLIRTFSKVDAFSGA